MTGKPKRGRPQRLTPKMETFVDCYFANGFNGALAYEQAGYSYTKDASNEADKLAVKADLATGLISSEAATEEERIAAETARIEQQELAKRKQLVQGIFYFWMGTSPDRFCTFPRLNKSARKLTNFRLLSALTG